jgi:hypothetical protein
MQREFVRHIVDTVSSWDGIETAPHRFGGIEFRLGAVEVGHIHSNAMVDIPFTVRLRERLVAGSEAGLHHLLPDTGWITFYVRTETDVAQALRLYRLSYIHKRYRRPSDRQGDAYAAAVRALDFKAPVIDALYPTAADVDADVADT